MNTTRITSPLPSPCPRCTGPFDTRPAGWRCVGLILVAMLLLAVADVAAVRGQDAPELDNPVYEDLEYEDAENEVAEDGLASVPDMYGDYFARNTFLFNSSNIATDGFAHYPQRGRVKIGENNSVVPRDRFYFMYQQYQNAIESAIVPQPAGNRKGRSAPLNRFTLGAEKTWLNGLWSTEIRMPMMGGADTVYDVDVFTSYGNAGNLALVIKRLLFESETTAVSAGLGFSLPTGEDTEFDLGDEIFMLANEVVHLQPFLGYLQTGDRVFFQGFLQLDIPTGGNQVTSRIAGFATEGFGALTDQTFLFFDGSAGYWMYRDQTAPVVTGLAAIAELHFTGSLSNASRINGQTTNITTFVFQPTKDPLTAVTMTSGLHVELTRRTALRAAVVLPLVDEDARAFDSELWVSINCRY